MKKSNELKHLVDIAKSFDYGMLTTISKAGEIRARPMRLVAVKPTGTCVMVTSVATEKVDEIAADARCCVTLQDGRRFVSITGDATLDQSQDRIGLYYEKSWEMWFPEGESDPTIALIDIEPEAAEYWDGSGWNRVRFAIDAAKAAMGDDAVKRGSIDHGSLRMER